MLDQRWCLGGWVAVLDKHAILEINYCYKCVICGCQLEMGSEAEMTRTVRGAMGPLPKEKILE